MPSRAAECRQDHQLTCGSGCKRRQAGQLCQSSSPNILLQSSTVVDDIVYLLMRGWLTPDRSDHQPTSSSLRLVSPGQMLLKLSLALACTAQVNVLWPSQGPAAQPATNTVVQKAAPAEQQESFSSETMKILGSLKTDPPLPKSNTLPALRSALQSTTQESVRIEVLKHPLGVVGLEWSPNDSIAGHCLSASGPRVASHFLLA